MAALARGRHRPSRHMNSSQEPSLTLRSVPANVQLHCRVPTGNQETRRHLSHHFTLTKEEEATACTILPSSWVVGATHRQLEREVREALRHPVLESRPLGPSVLKWAHSFKVACHPGARHSISLIQRLVTLNVCRYTRAFSICACHKASHCPQPNSYNLCQPLICVNLKANLWVPLAVSALVTIQVQRRGWMGEAWQEGFTELHGILSPGLLIHSPPVGGICPQLSAAPPQGCPPSW